MTPTPQEHKSTSQDFGKVPEQNGDRVVISGMSGLFPQSHNVMEFSEKLYAKTNLVKQWTSRIKLSGAEMSQHYSGTISDIDRFDAQFFKVHHRLAEAMDPMSRILLEQAYQAIFDAGVNPSQLAGKKVGVYIGTSYTDTEKASFYTNTSKQGFCFPGSSKTMFANRISYWLDTKGPSVSIDEEGCSSTMALELAYQAIRRGECESAVVGGAFLVLSSIYHVHFGRIIKLASDGKTKSFDDNADGCAVSEAVNVLYLQKAKDALRIYADVIHVKNEFSHMLDGETGLQYGFYRKLSGTANFITKFYEDAGVPPQAVEYVEAFGSATPEADKVELQSIEDVFCQNRDDPLLVGSVMSNIGYTESASGISAITKVILGYHRGEMASNLHCEHPRKDIAALREGLMRVVTDHQPIKRSYAAVNGMTTTGVNSHVLLNGHYKPKDLTRYKTNIPYLINLSGRQEEAVHNLIDKLKCNPIDPEQVALLHNIHQTNISGHMARGFLVLDTNEEQNTISLCERAEYFDQRNRPLWFVYSGMGSQWTGMGAQLMQIPIFAAAIERCDKVLKPKGLDIVTIITADPSVVNNILYSFVGIAAIQIGLTDILRGIGIEPDGIIGHSVGELGCAYADGCLTAEEMILAAYYRGIVSLETKFIRGSMAAVGLGYVQISKICPPEIEVACHNGPDSSTISGPYDIMQTFLADLTAKGIFAREVPCSNIAYHSSYIAAAGPQLLKLMTEVIRSPKSRTQRWLSTSIPADKWDDPISHKCSAKYFTNNLLSPVLFEETSRLIPKDAILVEIAPHGLLQAILKRSLPSTCKNLQLMNRSNANNVVLLLQAVGDVFGCINNDSSKPDFTFFKILTEQIRLYMEGYNGNLQVLYPKIEIPVSTGTPFLSHLVKWEHSEKWPLSLYSFGDRRSSPTCYHVVTLYDTENSYLQGNFIRGHTLYPFSASLLLVWDTFAMIVGSPKKEISVIFSDVHLYAQPVLHYRRQLRLSVTIQRLSGNFEVLDGDSKVITGCIKQKYIKCLNEVKYEIDDRNEEKRLYSFDIYQILRDREYMYSNEFKSIESVGESLSEADLVWRDNWVTLLDGMLQLNTLRQPHHAVSQPVYIRNLYIDFIIHRQSLLRDSHTLDDKFLMKAKYLEEIDSTKCGGIILENVRFQSLPPLNNVTVNLKPLELELHADTKMNDKLGDQCFLPIETNVNANEMVKLQFTNFGSFGSFNWIEVPKWTGDGISVTVHFVGINSIDLKEVNSTSLFKKSTEGYGKDFSGITESGERVMGIVKTGAVSTQVLAQLNLLWPVPAHWSLEEAATVPLAFIQGFYCLNIKAQLSRGMKILVHGGAGALGQAIISIALAYDCEVFTTVGDTSKKQFLLQLFPELQNDHIGNSRDHTFGDMVMSTTKGRGCDIIISNVSGNLKNVSFNCLALNGKYIDVSQLYNQEKYDIGMKNINLVHYICAEFSSVFKNVDEAVVLHTMLSEGIAGGYVRPLSYVTYRPHEVDRAFELLASSRHRGRVLLHLQDTNLTAQLRLKCSEKRSHSVICGEENFGLLFADRLIERGAKKLCIHVPKKSLPYAQYKIRSWQLSGVEVTVLSNELKHVDDITSLINTTSTLGSVEGIYVAMDDNVDETFFNNLDSVSRKLCSKLRYFGALILGATNSSAVEKVCHQRVHDQLPASIVLLPEVKDNSCASVRRAAVDGVERALRSPHNMFLLQTSILPPATSLIKEIASVAGILIPENAKKSLTLEELGVPNHRLQAICTFLSIQCNLSFNEEQVSSLTVNEILNLERAITELPYEDKTGLSIYFNYIDQDELLAIVDAVLLPTLANNARMRDDEFDINQTYAFIIPGIEGHHERFRSLCERLKLPAMVLQPGFDHPHETFRETAERYCQTLLKKTAIKNNFYLVSYESGVMVALEVAAILEDRGLTGTVFCIGFAPDELQKHVSNQLSIYETEEQLLEEVVRHVCFLMAGVHASELIKPMAKTMTRDQKIDAYVRLLLPQVSHTAQYIRAVIQCVLGRIEQVQSYNVTPRPLRSKLVLMRAATVDPPPMDSILQQYSQHPLVTHQLRAPLADAATDLLCATVIHSNLDSLILEDFKAKNLCDTYFVNQNVFIKVVDDDDE